MIQTIHQVICPAPCWASNTHCLTSVVVLLLHSHPCHHQAWLAPANTTAASKILPSPNIFTAPPCYKNPFPVSLPFISSCLGRSERATKRTHLLPMAFPFSDFVFSHHSPDHCSLTRVIFIFSPAISVSFSRIKG